MNTSITEKRCSKCGEWKDANEFYAHSGNKSRQCKSCESQRMRGYYSDNREKAVSDMTRYRQKARTDAVEHYGGKCDCCGETRKEFLAIDHINGGGRKHQKEINGMAIGIWLKKHNYPDGFRVLCHNCNMSLGVFGYCPHQ